MKAAEATMETMENFMIYVVEIVVDVLKHFCFEECPFSPRFYILLRSINTTPFGFLRELKRWASILTYLLFLFIYVGMNLYVQVGTMG